jgi:hypothetical protein
LKKESSAYINLDYKLIQFLGRYNGPSLLITSALRTRTLGNPHSKHLHGHAVDIELDYDVVRYLDNALLVDVYDISFFIESPNSNYINQIPECYKKYFRHVSHATGAHIHLEI